MNETEPTESSNKPTNQEAGCWAAMVWTVLAILGTLGLILLIITISCGAQGNMH